MAASRKVSRKLARPWQRTAEQFLAHWAAAKAPGAPGPLRGTDAAVERSIASMPLSMRHSFDVLFRQDGTATEKAQRLGIESRALEDERMFCASVVCGGLRAQGIEIDRDGTTRQVAPMRALPKRHDAVSGPCGSCGRVGRCKAEELACSAIGAFVSGKPWAILPRTDATAERFRELFTEESSAAAGPGPTAHPIPDPAAA